MNENKVYCKFGSMLFVIILILTGSISVLVLYPYSNNASAGSAWSQTSAEDFEAGECDNVTIIGAGSEANLQIESMGITHWSEIEPKSGIAPAPRRQSPGLTRY